MSKMTVKDIRDMFADFDDDDLVYFDIGDSDLEQLSDSYRYSPTISSAHKDNLGDVVVSISSEYSR